MKKPEITIIVPVYNVEQSLSRCIDSILTQTFVDFELLLINDGSKDNSGKICDDYSHKDNRIKVFHKENNGVSSARNLGLKHAKGTYIAFIDSDDWVKDSYLDELYKASTDNSDLVVGSYTQFDENGNYYIREYTSRTYNLSKSVDIKQIEQSSTISICLFFHPWRKLFKTNIIREHNILFDESIFISEDTIFIMKYVCYCENIRIISNTSYMYYLPTSSNKYLMDLKDLDKHMELFEKCEETFYSNQGYHLDALKQLIFYIFFNNFMTYIVSKGSTYFMENITEYKNKKNHCINDTLKILPKKEFLYCLIILMYPKLGYRLIKLRKFIAGTLLNYHSYHQKNKRHNP